jgi:hypothetical protein
MNEMPDDRLWENGWDGHEAEQLRRLARLPFTEKLRWLEEASLLVRHLADAPRKPAVPEWPT